MSDFTDLLDMPITEAERPKPIPPGTYEATVGGYELDKSAQKQTPFVRYELNLTAPGDDVDMDALQEVGGIAGKKLRTTYYITDASVYRLREFLEACGVEVEGKTFREQLDAVPGSSVLVTVSHRAAGDNVFAEVTDVTSAE